MLKLFRLIAVIEGISYLLLIFIAVPIKYLIGNPEYVKLLGMPHGILFIMYIIFSFIINVKLKWSIKDLSIILFASLVPFGTFYVDKKYLKLSNY